MQLVAADIGNSSAKIAIEHVGREDRDIAKDRWCVETVFRVDEEFGFDSAVAHQEQPFFWAVSSVNQKMQMRLGQWVRTNRPADRFHVIQPDEIELETNVESRAQLGRDRLIAAWQAVELNSGGPVIVIDAGTAVTVDFVDEQNVFQGGLIFPGATSNFHALASQTDALPNLKGRGLAKFPPETPLGFVGKSTESAILLGVYQMQISAMKTAVEHLARLSDSKSEVLMTGRGITDIRPWLPQTWQWVPDLVLQGARNVGRKLLEQSHFNP